MIGTYQPQHRKSDNPTSRIIYTNSKLFNCGIKESAVCFLCNEEEETFIHYFYECEVTQRFWRETLNWVKEQMKSNIIFSKSEILLGIQTEGMYFWSFIFLIAKYYLFLCHDKEWPNLENFKNKVNEIRLIEYNVAVNCDKMKKHNSKWKFLSQ